LALQNRSCTQPKDRPLRDVLINHHQDSALAWFDGATQRDGSWSGAGGVIKTKDASVIKWTFNCGRGTNTRAELLGAWATLLIADHLLIPCIHVMGDSKVVIEWLIDKGRLQVSSVEGWKARIKSLAKNFQSISFQHIYKNFNSDADVLSKQAIGEPEGT
jgi:ribonuclease HI